jgi:class 3 adenylate cyclase
LNNESNEGELRPVTVLFADVSGFTALGEKLDPGSLRQLIGTCFDYLVPCIERYGGTIDKFVGDEIMALFGAPTAHENDPERALRAALDMRAALATFPGEGEIPLTVHVGLNSGLVYAGDVGGGSRRVYSVMGDAVNVAARLKAAAQPGEILAGPDTFRQAGHLFLWEEAGDLPLKGRSEPVRSFRLLSERNGAGRSRSLETMRGRRSALVGREEEMASFRRALGLLEQGQGGLLTLSGEAGLGKSRLLAEARNEAMRRGITWLEGRTLSFGRTLSYWPLLEIVQADCAIETDDSEAERLTKLARRLAQLFPEGGEEVLPYLATLLALPVPPELGERVRYLDGEAMRRQIYRSTRLLFARLAAQAPAVIVVEDIHWLDESSAALLEHLLPLVNESPLLFSLVSRPDSGTPLFHFRELGRRTYTTGYTEIALAPLSSKGAAELAQNLLGCRSLPASLRAAILEKAAGNPFFVEEVVHNLIEQGGLIPDVSGGWRVSAGMGAIPLPDTLQGLITARVDRLDEDLKHVLRLASVIGRSFFYRLLAGLADAESELDASLRALESHELIQESARLPELEYIFKHALVQEATYESILLQRRRELHGRVAHALEELFADRLEEFYTLLAYHYTKAEVWEKAQEYLFKAGDQAGSIAADAEALAHYELATGAYLRAFGDRWNPQERARLERKVGEALFRRGDQANARLHLEQAGALLGIGLPATSARLHAALALEILRFAGRQTISSRWDSLSEDSTTAENEEQLAVSDTLATVLLSSQPSATLYLALRQLNRSEKIRWTSGSFTCYALLGLGCHFGGLTPAVPFILKRLTALSAETQDAELLEVLAFFRGIHDHSAGRWASATERFDESTRRGAEIGEQRVWSASRCYLVDLLLERGHLALALAEAKTIVRDCEESGDHIARAYSLLWEGEALNRFGSLNEAEGLLRDAADALVGGAEIMNSIMTKGFLAHCLIRQGRLAEAGELAEEQLSLARSRRFSGLHSRGVHTAVAELRLHRAETAEPPDRGAAMRLADEACRAALKHGKGDAGGYPPAYRHQGTYEWLRGRPKKAEKSWQNSLERAVQLGARYEEALTRLEMGRRVGDRGELERAEAAFVEMGAAFDLAEARRLLDLKDHTGRK